MIIIPPSYNRQYDEYVRVCYDEENTIGITHTVRCGIIFGEKRTTPFSKPVLVNKDRSEYYIDSFAHETIIFKEEYGWTVEVYIDQETRCELNYKTDDWVISRAKEESEGLIKEAIEKYKTKHSDELKYDYYGDDIEYDMSYSIMREKMKVHTITNRVDKYVGRYNR